MNSKKWLLSGLVLALGAACSAQDENPVLRFKGKKLPAIRMVTTKGVKITNQTLKGKVAVIDFWASWCGPCLQMSETLEGIHKKYGEQGVQVIGADLGEESRADLNHSLRTHPKRYTVTVKNDALGEKLGVVGYPTVLIVDKKGVVRAIESGFSPQMAEEFDKLIASLLNEK